MEVPRLRKVRLVYYVKLFPTLHQTISYASTVALGRLALFAERARVGTAQG